MSLDDSLRGVTKYALLIGWRNNGLEELRGVYRSAERLYEHNHPQPVRESNEIGFQVRVVEWLKQREIYSAEVTRLYIKTELEDDSDGLMAFLGKEKPRKKR